jgi:pyruvate/2-oxoglutarate dehydrogenase complex dihydrolipoamide acyltransferase (E2) component
MNDLNPENYFEHTGGGTGAPSASLKIVNDFVYGEIVDQAMVPKKVFAKDEIEKDSRTGKDIMQLVVILQTDLRNWHNVSKVPTDDKGVAKPGAEDDGRRAIYVPPFSNIHAAIGEATDKKPLRNGAKLGVKIVELKDTGKGNPLKIHVAKYEPPAAAPDGFFGGDQAATEAAPQTAAAQAEPASAPAAAAPPAAPQQDPWAAPGAPAAAADQPPF